MQIAAFYSQVNSPELNGIVHLLITLYRTVINLLYDVCYVCWLFYALLILYRSFIIYCFYFNRIYEIAFYSVVIVCN